jgi:molybdopterin-guanine dinucleotide biosynthesis protein A
MVSPPSDLTAFVLAGGRSSRMGRDKAFLEFDGISLLRRALLLANTVTRDVRIVGPTSKFSAFGIVVEDAFHDRGPLGGIHAALNASTKDLNLVIAVDMPFLSEEFLTFLLQRARASDAAVTIARTHSGWEPLCAIYRRSFAVIAEAALKSGENKIDRLFQHLELNPITEEDLQSFPKNQFRNLNTPEDLSKPAAQSPKPDVLN